MIRAGSIHGGFVSGPRMQLAFDCYIMRAYASVTAIGSNKTTFVALDNAAPIPCDVTPVSDMLLVSQVGQTEQMTHIIHFEAGTNVQARDEIVITKAPRDLQFVNRKFYIFDVLEPSETIAYIRCHARRGKEE